MSLHPDLAALTTPPNGFVDALLLVTSSREAVVVVHAPQDRTRLEVARRACGWGALGDGVHTVRNALDAPMGAGLVVVGDELGHCPSKLPGGEEQEVGEAPSVMGEPVPFDPGLSP